MLHIWMSHIAHVNGSCHAYEWVMSHILMRYVTHVNESCHTCEWVMSHMWMSHMNKSCYTYEWVIYWWDKSHMWICGAGVQEKSSRVISTSHVPHTINESCPSKWVMFLLSTEICPTYKWDMPHVDESCLSVHLWMIRVSLHTYEWVMSHIQMRHATHTNECADK